MAEITELQALIDDWEAKAIKHDSSGLEALELTARIYAICACDLRKALGLPLVAD